MKKYAGYDETVAFTGDFEQIELGGQICKIKAVTVTEKPYGELLTIDFDIEEGKQKGFYQRKYEQALKNNPSAKWQGKLYQTVKESDLKFFKGFMTAIENSNNGFKFNFDETKLVGKLFGGVFGEEEYMGTDGVVKCAVKCVRVRSVEEVRKGVEIPPRKEVVVENTGFTYVDVTDELPF